MQKNKTLIYGIGNDIVTDDAIGPKLTWRIKEKLNRSDVDFETAFVGGLDILERIKDYKKVIFIDAIKTEDGIPGTVYLFTVDDFNETLHLSNIHDVSFLTAIKLGNEIGYNIPKEIWIIAIEIVEDLIYSDKFSVEIENKYEDIFNEVLNYVEKYK